MLARIGPSAIQSTRLRSDEEETENLAHFPAASCCGFVDPLFPSSHRAPSALSPISSPNHSPNPSRQPDQRVPTASQTLSDARASPDAPSAAPSAAPPLREHRDVSPFTTTVADLLLHANLSAFLPRRLSSFRPCHLKATRIGKVTLLHQYRHYSRIIPFSKPQYRDLAQGCVQRHRRRDPSPNRTPDTYKAAKPSFRAHSTRTPPTREEAQGESKGTSSREDRPLSETTTVPLTREQSDCERGSRKSPKTPSLRHFLRAWTKTLQHSFLDNCSKGNIADLLRASRRFICPFTKTPPDATRSGVRNPTRGRPPTFPTTFRTNEMPLYRPYQ